MLAGKQTAGVEPGGSEFRGIKKKEPAVHLLVGSSFVIYSFFLVIRSIILDSLFLLISLISIVIGVVYLDFGVKGFYTRTVKLDETGIKAAKKRAESKFEWRDIAGVQIIEQLTGKLGKYVKPSKPQVTQAVQLKTSDEKINEIAVKTEFNQETWDLLTEALKKACEARKIQFVQVSIDPYIRLVNREMRRRMLQTRLNRL